MTSGVYSVGTYQSGESQVLTVANNTPRNGTRKGLIICHGHNATATQFEQDSQAQSIFVKAAADAGMIVLSIDAAGQQAFGNSAVMTAITNAYNWLTGAGGAATGKVGLMGWSMGGLSVLNWIKRNAAKCGPAWLWTPVSDLDFFHNAGYSAPYSTGYTNTTYSGSAGNVAPGGFAAEIDTAYGGNYAANSVGFRVHDEYASWAGIGVPIKVCAPPDDNVIPMAMNQAFVTGVNDPNVTFLQAAQGSHTQLFNFITPAAVLAHYNSIAW